MAKLIYKKKIFITSILSLLSLCVFGQQLQLKFTSLKFRIKKDISFTVENSSDSSKVYHVALEIYKPERGWFEVKGDVFNYSHKMKTKNFSIHANKINSHKFLPQRTHAIVLKEKYRLKVVYGNSYDSKSQLAYSNELIFNQ